MPTDPLTLQDRLRGRSAHRRSCPRSHRPSSQNKRLALALLLQLLVSRFLPVRRIHKVRSIEPKSHTVDNFSGSVNKRCYKPKLAVVKHSMRLKGIWSAPPSTAISLRYDIGGALDSEFVRSHSQGVFV